MFIRAGWLKAYSLKTCAMPVIGGTGGFYDKEGADELVFLDISASSEQRKTMVAVVRNTAKEVFIPFAVGGGISTIDDIRNLLYSGG